MRYPPSLTLLIEELKRLPGIGEKNAQRLAFYLLGAPRERGEALSRAIVDMKNRIGSCTRCHNLAEGELCPICRDPARQGSYLCVVETPRDLMAIESTGQYRGGYHVLTGVLSPMKGIGPEDLTIGKLVQRVSDEKIQEVIVATNLDVEGEATSSFLAGILKPKGIRITRLARGIPVGGSLENADQVTLGMALDGRNVL